MDKFQKKNSIISNWIFINKILYIKMNMTYSNATLLKLELYSTSSSNESGKTLLRRKLFLSVQVVFTGLVKRIPHTACKNVVATLAFGFPWGFLGKHGRSGGWALK